MQHAVEDRDQTGCRLVAAEHALALPSGDECLDTVQRLVVVGADAFGGPLPFGGGAAARETR